MVCASGKGLSGSCFRRVRSLCAPRVLELMRGGLIVSSICLMILICLACFTMLLTLAVLLRKSGAMLVWYASANQALGLIGFGLVGGRRKLRDTDLAGGRPHCKGEASLRPRLSHKLLSLAFCVASHASAMRGAAACRSRCSMATDSGDEDTAKFRRPKLAKQDPPYVSQVLSGANMTQKGSKYEACRSQSGKTACQAIPRMTSSLQHLEAVCLTPENAQGACPSFACRSVGSAHTSST